MYIYIHREREIRIYMCMNIKNKYVYVRYIYRHPAGLRVPRSTARWRGSRGAKQGVPRGAVKACS